jgi:CCR4-NOT transcription complex subunit 1
MLRSDDISSRFFRIYTEYAIRAGEDIAPEHAAAAESPSAAQYVGVDSFSKLIIVLLKNFSENTKMALLRTVLNSVTAVLDRAHASTKTPFNQKPFFRLLCNLLFEVHSAEEASHLQLYPAFSIALHQLRPALYPGFGFAWLELISHRCFMPKLLLMKTPKGWLMLERLLVDLLAYLAPYMSIGAKANDALRALYTGTLRVFLVLLHDFPEFLADHHYGLCDVIAPSCIQLRNLVLSAFPRSMRLPDPFTPNLKVDLLPEIAQQPRILSNFSGALQAANIRHDIDLFLRTRQTSHLATVRARLSHSPEDIAAGAPTYNVPLINSLVLCLGIKAIEETVPPDAPVSYAPVMEMFTYLLAHLDSEGRYSLLNAIANQLRFPNAYTYFFSCLLLYLFSEAKDGSVQEQVTRVLLERLIVNRPHPWGLLITFIELIQNRAYNFWSHSFIKCAPEIERLFESVARSCMTASRAVPGDNSTPLASVTSGGGAGANAAAAAASSAAGAAGSISSGVGSGSAGGAGGPFSSA